MDFEKGPLQKLNKILTVAAVIIAAVWILKWLGPEGRAIQEESGRTLFSYSGILSLGIAVCCLGYLVWRFLSWLFWKKYFGDKQPPDDPLR